MPPQLSETFELLISILAFRLGSGLIILMQLLRSGGNILHNIHIWTYYFKWTGDIEIGIRYHPGRLTSAIRKSSILGFRLGSDLIILMPEFPPRFPPRPQGPTHYNSNKKHQMFNLPDFHPRFPPRFRPNHPNSNSNIETNASWRPISALVSSYA